MEEQSAQNEQVAQPIDPVVKAASVIAAGMQADPAAVPIEIRGAWRDLNCKGSGDEDYRRAMSPGEGWRWVSEDRLPRVGIRASERRCSVTGNVYPGDLTASFTRSLRGGRPSGGAPRLYEIKLAVGTIEGKPWLRTCEYHERRDGQLVVTLPDGEQLTVPSPEWR